MIGLTVGEIKTLFRVEEVHEGYKYFHYSDALNFKCLCISNNKIQLVRIQIFRNLQKLNILFHNVLYSVVVTF